MKLRSYKAMEPWRYKAMDYVTMRLCAFGLPFFSVEFMHRICHTLLYSKKFSFIAIATLPTESRLSITLIATFEIIRKRHSTDDILRHQLGQTKFGQAFESTHAFDHCLSNVIKGLSPPRTAVKYARYLRVVKEIQINCNRIINSDKVTLLLPLSVAVPAPK